MERLRVLTLNIWNRQGPWEARRRLIVDGLRREAADVVALQEVLRLERSEAGRLCQGEELAAELGLRLCYGPAHVLDPQRGFVLGNAILTRFAVLREVNLPLPNPERGEERALLHALLETPAGALPMFVTHLEWQLHLSWVRCQQVRFIADCMDQQVQRARAEGLDVLPAVLAGDLNAEPDSDEVRFLRGLHPLPGLDGSPPRSVYYADCFALVGQGDGATFCRSNRYAAREHEPDRRIDYIFVGRVDGRLRGEPLAARRCLTEPVEGVFASDHYGVVADLQVGPRQRELV
ncbi:MAG: endonuclease/exonuclease/phosphatase family protein [Myxococcales bacterium]|nr:endonuclease/exonuclease/phosphatase family protein [Myxococcota bacterium]MDW8283840.1 endonuclease/exonuclease/phosphatase family protein [Myxococcales bacterium]